jgi:hypothetical protein
MAAMEVGPKDRITADLAPLQGRAAVNPVTPRDDVAGGKDPIIGAEFAVTA